MQSRYQKVFGWINECVVDGHGYSGIVFVFTTAHLAPKSMNKLQSNSPLGIAHLEAALDEALAESFPASDPVAVSFPPAVELERESNKTFPRKASTRNVIEAKEKRCPAGAISNAGHLRKTRK